MRINLFLDDFSIFFYYENENFIKNEEIIKLIKDFLKTNPKIYEPSISMKVDAFNMKFKNEKIIFILSKDIKTKKPIILGGCVKTLVKAGIIKNLYIEEGQNKLSENY